MTEFDTVSEDVVFRSSKRRKVFRKRPDREEDVDTRTEQVMEHSDTPALSKRTGSELIGNDEESETQSATDRAPLRKPGTSRKAGVGFSNSRGRRADDSQEPSEHNAVVRAGPVESATVAAASRFTMPTGQAIVKDDKHM